MNDICPKMGRKAKFALTVFAVLSLTASSLSAQSRKLHVGDEMPEFTATQISETQISYKHGGKGVSVVAFLSSRQKQSLQAAEDLKKILTDLTKHKDLLTLYVVTDNVKTCDYLKSTDDSKPFNFHCIVDDDFKLWGQFGIIATPTLVISDKSDKIIWIKGGYGYDFAPVANKYIQWGLGIGDKPEAKIVAKSLQNSTAEAQIKRHMKLSQMLEDKGRIDSAIKELRKCLDLGPKTIEVALKLGELYCKSGENEAAIAMVGDIDAKSYRDQAEVGLVNGWAKRQMDMLDEAEIDLIEATKHNPSSARAYFELGKVYQAKGDSEKAAEAFHTALTKIFGE